MSLIPFPYNLIAGAVGSIVLIGAGYGFFKHEVNLEVRKEIAAYVTKRTKDDTDLQAVEVKTNTKIQIQYVDRVKVIHDQGVSNVQVITKYVHDSELLSNGWVSAHDDSSSNRPIDSTSATDGSNSTITASQALTTVATNYATCNQWRAEVDAWQEWVTETNKNIVAANKKANK